MIDRCFNCGRDCSFLGTCNGICLNCGDRMQVDPAFMVRVFTKCMDKLERLRTALLEQEDEIQQVLGKAMNYPWYKDDQTNFPGATEDNGVCVGEHVAVSIAMEAAKTIERLKDELKKALK